MNRKLEYTLILDCNSFGVLTQNPEDKNDIKSKVVLHVGEKDRLQKTISIQVSQNLICDVLESIIKAQDNK